MPPRYAYWTILIDGRPTAFRARDQEELQPTVFQLKRKNADVVLKWFARGGCGTTPNKRSGRRRAWSGHGGAIGIGDLAANTRSARPVRQAQEKEVGDSARRRCAAAIGLLARHCRSLVRDHCHRSPCVGQTSNAIDKSATVERKAAARGQRPWSSKPQSPDEPAAVERQAAARWSAAVGGKPRPEGQRSRSSQGAQGQRRPTPWRPKPPSATMTSSSRPPTCAN